jgi:hypothetical protein
MTNSGSTDLGLTYPIAGIDQFTPSSGIQDLAETADGVIAAKTATLHGEIGLRPRFIRANDATSAQTQSAADPNNVYWVSV